MPAVETLLDGLDFNDDAAVVLDQALGPLLSTLSSGSDKVRPAVGMPRTSMLLAHHIHKCGKGYVAVLDMHQGCARPPHTLGNQAHSWLVHLDIHRARFSAVT
jgi:hypothetical protein